MGFIEWLKGLLGNPAFWAILGGFALLAWGGLRAVVGKIPVLKSFLQNRNTVIGIAVIGLLVTTGIVESFDLGSMAQGMDDWYISDLQVTTNFASTTGCTISENSNQDDLIDVRCTDYTTGQVNETAAQYEVDTGKVTVFRSGNLDPASCTVQAYSSDFGSEKTPGDGTSYNIVEVTTLGELEVYLKDNAAAATTSPKEKAVLTFGDGVASRDLGVLIEVDVDAHEALNQYSYRDVYVDVCGKVLTFRIHQMST